MTLSVDDKGLSMEAHVDCDNNQEARQVYSSIERGDMDGMSFCFCVKDENWENLDSDMPIRHIKQIAKVYEVSAVNEPAYEDTDIFSRDKTALDSARAAVDTARSSKLDSSNEIETYKIKNKILGEL
jgi:HK97 family phage prohead protease